MTTENNNGKNMDSSLQKPSMFLMTKMFSSLDKHGYRFDNDMSEGCGIAFSFSWNHYKKDIALWTVGSNIEHVWIKGIGTNIENKPLNSNWLKHIMEMYDKKFCSRCNRVIEKVAGHHFVGRYCEKCWEIYKEENKRVCTLCRKPEYMCHC